MKRQPDRRVAAMTPNASATDACARRPGRERRRLPALGNSAAAAAREKALAYYVSYRQDGGENHGPAGRLSFAVAQSLLSGDADAARSLLEQVAPQYEEAGFGSFIRALQAIVAGGRDRTLADAPDLHYTMAAEILLMIETLKNSA